MIDPLTLSSTIPLLLNSLSGLTNKQYTVPKQYQENSKEIFKQGGKIRGHNKYNAPSHEEGGQMVDNQGIPNPNGINEIEGKESKYTYTRLNKKNPSYIFTGEDSKKIDKLTKKYKDSNTNSLQKNALELEVQRIENDNEMKKKNSVKYKHGGKIKKYKTGGPLENLLGGLNELSPLLRGYSTNADKPISQLSSTPISSVSSNGGIVKPIDRSNIPQLDSTKIPMLNVNLNKQLPTTEQVKSSPLTTLETLRNITLGGNATQLLAKAEKENPIMTNYGNTRNELNKLESNLDPLREQTTQASNQIRNINRNATTSYTGYANREAQRVANLQQSLQGITLQERNLANTIASQKAQVESNIARDNSQTLRQNRINNQQNQAQNRNIKRQVVGDIIHDIDRRSTTENNRNFAQATTAQGMAILKNMYPNFSPNAEDVKLLQKASSGKTLSSEEQTRIENMNLIKFN